MRFVIQRVQHASVTVDNETVGSIGKGFLVLIGVEDSDTRELADRMISKMTALTPSIVASWMSIRVRIPSVSTSMRVSEETLFSKRTR